VITAAAVEASQAPLIGHHQLTVGLLRANLLSPNARIVIASAEPARGGVPMFKYTDVDALAAKYHQGDLIAAMEALIRNGPNVKYVPNNAYADAKLIVAWWAAALARRLPSGMAVYAVSVSATRLERPRARCEGFAIVVIGVMRWATTRSTELLCKRAHVAPARARRSGGRWWRHGRRAALVPGASVASKALPSALSDCGARSLRASHLPQRVRWL
jgi:hypothetical protein